MNFEDSEKERPLSTSPLHLKRVQTLSTLIEACKEYAHSLRLRHSLRSSSCLQIQRVTVGHGDVESLAVESERCLRVKFRQRQQSAHLQT